MYAGPKIIKIIREEDGTTTGETVYIDDEGGRWIKTYMTGDNCGTGDRIGILGGNQIWT